MRKWTRLWVALAASISIVASGAALAQSKPADCVKAGAPEKVDGQVVRIDPNQEKLTLRASNGAEYEFRVSKETLQQYKVGDRIEAKLRTAQNCTPSAS